jgi:hypothetical protein
MFIALNDFASSLSNCPRQGKEGKGGVEEFEFHGQAWKMNFLCLCSIKTNPGTTVRGP